MGSAEAARTRPLFDRGRLAACCLGSLGHDRLGVRGSALSGCGQAKARLVLARLTCAGADAGRKALVPARLRACWRLAVLFGRDRLCFSWFALAGRAVC